MVTVSPGELFAYIKIVFYEADDHGSKTTILRPSEGRLHSIKEQRHRSFGRCYTIQISKELRNRAIKYLEIK